jgi:hypothetical protein
VSHGVVMIKVTPKPTVGVQPSYLGMKGITNQPVRFQIPGMTGDAVALVPLRSEVPITGASLVDIAGRRIAALQKTGENAWRARTLSARMAAGAVCFVHMETHNGLLVEKVFLK